MTNQLQGSICHRLSVQGDRESGWDHQTSLLRDATWHSEHEAHEPRCPGIAQVPFHHPKFINVSSAGDRKTFSKNISSTKRSREESVRAYFITPGSAPRLCATYPARPKRRCPAHHTETWARPSGTEQGRRERREGFLQGAPRVSRVSTAISTHTHTAHGGARSPAFPSLPPWC